MELVEEFSILILRSQVFICINTCKNFGHNIIQTRVLFSTFISKTFLDCTVKVYSGDTHSRGIDDRFRVVNVLQVPSYEDYGNNQWLTPINYPGNFILNLGCSDDSYSAVELVNTYRHNWCTKRFKVFLR